MKGFWGKKENLKTYSLILVPLILGFLINSPILGYYFPFLLSVAFLGFWFWVGMKFAKLNQNRAFSLLIGNSLNMISFFLFIWSFYVLADENRNLLIAVFSQNYAGPTLSISAAIYLLTGPKVLTNEYVIISYILMAVVFAAGFFYEVLVNQK
ncbi:MAG: hypothetical protein ACOWWO_10965 [Peptococcaceae bacterium]